MITTITQTNTIPIPPEVKEHFGIKPGYRLDWRWTDQKDEIVIRVIPDRGHLARQLLGAGRRFSPETDAVADLVAERAVEKSYKSYFWLIRSLRLLYALVPPFLFTATNICALFPLP